MKYRTRMIRMNAPRLKPVSKISDRAKRYRANADDSRPGPPKQCGFCGRRRNVEVHHISGNESHGEPANLMWSCRKCNTTVGNVMKRAGIGRRTRQMNPGRGRKSSMAEYGAAIKVMRGVWPGDVSKAVQTIYDTPPSVRSAYTARTWGARRAMYGPAGRRTEIPF